MDREDLAEAQRVLNLTRLEKADVVAPVKLPRCIVEWIKRQGPVSRWIRNLVITELRKVAEAE